ncbi:MAG TPA: YncE family protein, partial [Kofleriaceae bacterium]|nr:YncE family protein [Kofleriaceae bacterium]
MVLRLSIAISCAAALGGCTASGEDVRPPPDQIFFPSGVGLAPAATAGDPEPALFVVNANSELRYDTGSVVAVDLDAVDALIATWLGGDQPADPSGCEQCCIPDGQTPSAINCKEAGVLVPDAIVRTGNFATDVAVQALDTGNLRVLLPVRGDPSLTWIDYDPAARTLDCGGGGEIPICDDTHRLTQMRNDLDLPPLSGEPFSLFVDGVNGYTFITHLVNGVVTLVATPSSGDPPVIEDAIAGLFAANPQTGQRNSVGVAGRTPGAPDDLVYITSSTEDRVQMLTVRDGPDGLGIVPGEFFFLDRIFPSEDGRGIAFSGDGERAYLVNRLPPSVQVLDTSLDETGFPRNRVIGAIEICRDASVLTVGDLGAGERIYVTCFGDGEVWVLDPNDLTLEATIDVGRGPHRSALSVARKRLYVANYLEDTIAVVDLTPGAPTENRMVLK